MRVAITGAAGFLGAKATAELLGRGHEVVALDHLDTTHTADLKRERIGRFAAHDGFRLIAGDITNADDVGRLVGTQPDVVVHLAARAGLRRSTGEAAGFVSANVAGFAKVVQAALDAGVGRLVYASSGAVYGGTPAVPFREDDPAAWPVSLYAATKRCDELLALVYADAGLRCTGLRFSTIYGTGAGPDAVVSLFADRIARGEPIDVHGHGRMVRDFLWGDDAAHAVVLAAEDERSFRATPVAGGALGGLADAPWRVLNVATGRSVQLIELIRLVEATVGREAKLNLVDATAGEVHENRMDVGALERALGFRPAVTVEEGVPKAVEWYLDYLGRLR